MKIKVTSVGKTEFTADPTYTEPRIRAAIAADPAQAGDVIGDTTDTWLSDMSTDDYVTVTEDDGTPLWSGWLWPGMADRPAPPDF